MKQSCLLWARETRRQAITFENYTRSLKPFQDEHPDLVKQNNIRLTYGFHVLMRARMLGIVILHWGISEICPTFRLSIQLVDVLDQIFGVAAALAILPLSSIPDASCLVVQSDRAAGLHP